MAICQKISYGVYPIERDSPGVPFVSGTATFKRVEGAPPYRRVGTEVCAENAESLKLVVAGSYYPDGVIYIGEPRQATSLFDRFRAWLSSWTSRAF